ncbi:hypothetical protein OG345_41965 (plasmid) [Streptomyces sp. NBC_01220]|uniref:hypothetical protein n=1 Tax=Streptomyces sp. NBC_01220 TaxID=2903781 RepID=UPI00352C1AF4|nr:hypothetical protein OG345_41965 [Streptomyces sp. NBC_01220]
MSTPPVDRIEIEVGKFPVNGALIEHKGKYTLHLSPMQTLETATRHVQNVLPSITREAAERLIREQCPEFRSLDDMLGVTDTPVRTVERLPDPAGLQGAESMRRTRRRRAVLVAALLPALAASWAVGRYTTTSDSAAPGEAVASAPDKTDDAPFENSQFEFFAGSSQIACNPISTLEAECTDSDGMVMATKAATGPDSTIFTFSYGSERIGLRLFYDSEYAATWARQDGSRELYPHMKVHGRYVLWGTDASRIEEYTELLQEADRTAGPHTMGTETPLPPRLAALALGTLGLDNHEVNQIIARPDKATSDAPATMAARLVLGLDTAPTWSGHDGDDIVALAVGIEPRLPGSGEDIAVTFPDTDTAAGSATTTRVTTGTTGAEIPPPTPAVTPPTTKTPPPADPKPTAPPPPTTTPDTSTTQPSTPPPAETTLPPAEEVPSTPEPPVEETPTVPPTDDESGQTPPPVEETPTVPPTDDETPEGETPPPADTETPAAPVSPDDGQSGDLLIMNSAWTVAA